MAEQTAPVHSIAGRRMNLAQLGTGVVRHRRLRPQGHAFVYPSYFLMLPLRTLRTAPEAPSAVRARLRSTKVQPRRRQGRPTCRD